MTVMDLAKAIATLVGNYKDDPFVKKRTKRNLAVDKPTVTRDDFWEQLVVCLLTTQQNVSPGSPVHSLIKTRPFPLGYKWCCSKPDVQAATKATLGQHGIIRFVNKLPEQISKNFETLEDGLWSETMNTIDSLRLHQDAKTERKTAAFIQKHFEGFGPKQSRNLLQCLGLTRYEIPIDSRVGEWLTQHGVPVPKKGPSGIREYCKLLDRIRQLCDEAEVFPCIFDAAVFVNKDGGWSEEDAELVF